MDTLGTKAKFEMVSKGSPDRDGQESTELYQIGRLWPGLVCSLKWR